MKPAAIVNINIEGNTKRESSNRILSISPFPAKMEEQNVADTGAGESSLVDGSAHWWWAIGSGAQIMWGVRSIRRGYGGDTRLMPLKALGVASLFVGAIATTSVAFLSATGIHTVQDAIEFGDNIRTNLGITPQIPKKQITETDDL